jgi:glycine/D-amino acid oxidase-like deaminating enzyme
VTLPIWLNNLGERTREKLDVAIVGGGIVGAGCAYWLSRRGGLRAGLFEAGRLSSGATGRSAGFVLRGIQSYYNRTVDLYGRDTAREIFSLAEQSQQYIREFLQLNGDTFEYEPCGSYLLACSLDELEDLCQSAELMNEDGFRCEYYKDDPIERDFYGAIYNPDDFGVNPARLARSLIEASGVNVFASEPVEKIDPGGGRPVLYTAARAVECETILLATNAYSPLLEPWFQDKIEPRRGQVLVTQPLKKNILDRLCYANYGWEYFRQLPDKRLLLGGCRELHFAEEVGYVDMVTQPVQNSLEHYLKDRFPDVAGVHIDYRWAGIMGFTQDGLPLVGELAHKPRVFYAVAMNGHGLGYGPALSRVLVELALDGKNPGIFSAERLSQKPKTTAVHAPDRGP